MPAPRVFVSSTCYDLKYVRENLRFLIKSLGYEPILSEYGAVFYDPSFSTQDSCLAEVPSCQLFILIIGGRFGSASKGGHKSITNAEYDAAVAAKVPIFALVERAVFEQQAVYLANKRNSSLNAARIAYPAVDSPLIFEFVESVRSNVVNNALVPFSDFEEMQNYLKQQWAGMMYRFLTTESEAKRVGDMLSALSTATQKIEFLSRQVVNSVGDVVAKASVEFYDFLLQYEVIRDLAYWKLTPSPKNILAHETFDEFCGRQVEIGDEYDDPDEDSISGGGPPYHLSKYRYEKNEKQYISVRKALLKKLSEKGISLSEFLSDRASADSSKN